VQVARESRGERLKNKHFDRVQDTNSRQAILYGPKGGHDVSKAPRIITKGDITCKVSSQKIQKEKIGIGHQENYKTWKYVENHYRTGFKRKNLAKPERGSQKLIGGKRGGRP